MVFRDSVEPVNWDSGFPLVFSIHKSQNVILPAFSGEIKQAPVDNRKNKSERMETGGWINEYETILAAIVPAGAQSCCVQTSS